MRAPKPHIWKLLVATDFSPHLDHAFHAALARRLVARLQLRYVVHNRGDPAPGRHHVVLAYLA